MGFTCEDLGKVLGVSAATISRFENGHDISGETLARLQRWLLEETNGSGEISNREQP